MEGGVGQMVMEGGALEGGVRKNVGGNRAYRVTGRGWQRVIESREGSASPVGFDEEQAAPGLAIGQGVAVQK